jgi:hypothetical protein
MSVKTWNERNSMDASTAPNAASGASAPGNGDGPSATANGGAPTGTPDPLQRLAAELEATAEQRSTEREQPDGAELYEEAHRLLEEAWSIFTECQVMRDGLLTACLEIERTMGSIQLRISGLPAAIESNGNGHSANGKAALASSSNGAALSANGNSHSSNGDGHSSNGNGHSSNGAGPGSNGAGPGSNGAGPH